MGNPDINVRREASRFIIESEGAEAGYAEFADREGLRDFHHTVVDPAFRGMGMSKPLLREALDATREEGLRVLPTCSAVAGFIEKHEEYQDLLAE